MKVLRPTMVTLQKKAEDCVSVLDLLNEDYGRDGLPIFVDTKLVCIGGIVPAQACVLQQASEVFRNCFDSQGDQYLGLRVINLEYDVAMISKMVQLIYTGSIRITPQGYQNLKGTLDDFRIKNAYLVPLDKKEQTKEFGNLCYYLDNEDECDNINRELEIALKQNKESTSVNETSEQEIASTQNEKSTSANETPPEMESAMGTNMEVDNEYVIVTSVPFNDGDENGTQKLSSPSTSPVATTASKNFKPNPKTPKNLKSPSRTKTKISGVQSRPAESESPSTVKDISASQSQTTTPKYAKAVKRTSTPKTKTGREKQTIIDIEDLTSSDDDDDDDTENDSDEEDSTNKKDDEEAADNEKNDNSEEERNGDDEDDNNSDDDDITSDPDASDESDVITPRKASLRNTSTISKSSPHMKTRSMTPTKRNRTIGSAAIEETISGSKRLKLLRSSPSPGNSRNQVPTKSTPATKNQTAKSTGTPTSGGVGKNEGKLASEDKGGWVEPNYNDKEWFLKQNMTCQVCNRYYDLKGAALDCISAHKRVRCYFCFNHFRNGRELIVHFRERHELADSQSVICPLQNCKSTVSFNSVSCHVLSKHFPH